MAVAGAASLAVPDVFTEPELVGMIGAYEVETVDGDPVDYGGDGDDSDYEDPRYIIARSGWIGAILALGWILWGFPGCLGSPVACFQL